MSEFEGTPMPAETTTKSSSSPPSEAMTQEQFEAYEQAATDAAVRNWIELELPRLEATKAADQGAEGHNDNG